MAVVWQQIEAGAVDDLKTITFTLRIANHQLIDVDWQRTDVAHGKRPSHGKTWWNVSTRAINTLYANNTDITRMTKHATSVNR